MKLIDKMLSYAKGIATSKLCHFGVDELFIEALGLNPERYIVLYPNGEHGYDDMAALMDAVPEIWAENN